MNNKKTQDNIDFFLSDLEKNKNKSTTEENQKLLLEIENNFQQQKSITNQKDNYSENLLAEIENNFPQQSLVLENNNELKNDLLIEIENKFQQEKSAITKKNKSENSLLIDIQAKFQQQKPSTNHTEKSLLAEKNLEEIATNFSHKKAEIKQHQKIDNLEQIKQKELEKQRQEKVLIKKAENWLKNLDPYSDEGFWFEQFSLSYPSKLEAAIDYIKALQ